MTPFFEKYSKYFQWLKQARTTRARANPTPLPEHDFKHDRFNRLAPGPQLFSHSSHFAKRRELEQAPGTKFAPFGGRSEEKDPKQKRGVFRWNSPPAYVLRTTHHLSYVGT